MAHNINRNRITGKDSIVYAGETPWHRLGQPVADAFDAETALKLGGLDFTVEKQPIQTGERQKFEELHPVTRNAVSKVEEFAETGRGSDLKHVRGTLWGAYNAITEYVDHSKTGDNLAYMARGSGLKIKARAFELAEAMLAAN